MPITLPPISRRRFLKGSLAAAALSLAPRQLWGSSQSFDPNRLALFADTHLPAIREQLVRHNVNPWLHFQKASNAVLALDPLPANVLVAGDVAISRGELEDYVAVVDALKPLREAGLPIHLGLGNHDNRANITTACGLADLRVTALPQHRVMFLPLPHADFYILDSLFQTKVTPGTLGTPQIAWLTKCLDARADRPAVVMLHHHMHRSTTERQNGLTDTPEFLAVVQPRRQVKAVLFGHTHMWQHYTTDGLHFINLPTSAYIFKPEQISGWVDAHLTSGAISLKLRALTPDHPWDQKTVEFPFRQT